MRRISQYIVLSLLLMFPFVALSQIQESSNKPGGKISDWNYFPIPKVGTKYCFASYDLQGNMTSKWVDEVTSVENENDATLVTIATDYRLHVIKKTIKYDYLNNEIKTVKVVYPTGPKDDDEILVRLPLTVGNKWKCRPGALVYDSVLGFDEVTIAGNKYKCVVLGITHAGVEVGSADWQSRCYYAEGLGEIGSAYIMNDRLIWGYKRTDISIENPKPNTTQKSSRDSIFQKELTEAINNRDFKRTISSLSQVIPFEPNNDTLYYQRAWCQYNLNEFSYALKDVDRAIGINISIVDYFILRASIRLKILQSGNKSWNNYSMISKDLLKVIELDPNNAWAYIVLGYCYYLTKEIPLVLKSFNKAYNLSPKELEHFLNGDTTLCLLYGIGLLAMNKPSEALKKFELLENNKDEKRFSYFCLGMAYWGLENYQTAIRYFTLSIQNGVELNGEVYFFRASVYFNMQKNKEAIEDLKKVLTINPKNEVAYEMLKIIKNKETR